MLTKAQLARYIQLRDKRRALNRQAEMLEREEKTIAADIVTIVAAAGGSCRRFGYQLHLTPRAGRPSWKDEFIKSCGVAAAEKVQSACPPQQILDVTPPAE